MSTSFRQALTEFTELTFFESTTSRNREATTVAIEDHALHLPFSKRLWARLSLRPVFLSTPGSFYENGYLTHFVFQELLMN